MRKFLVILLSVLSIFCLAVPAFGIGFSGSSDDVVYPVLNFDVINFSHFGYSYTLPYPFSSALPGGIAPFDYIEQDVFGEAHYDPGASSYLTGTIGGPGFADTDNGIYFLSGPQFLNLSTLSADGFNVRFDTADLRITYVELIVDYYGFDRLPGSQNYSAKLSRFRFSSASSLIASGGLLNVGSMFEGLKDSAVNGQYVFARNISFLIKFSRIDAATPYFDFEVKTSGLTIPDGSSDFDNWLYFNNLRAYDEPRGDEVLDSIGEAVLSFFKLEIFPGFSIDKIFVIILTIGIMLWFITLLI